MTDNEKMREEFEDWLNQGNHCGCNENMWKAWQAAQSVLVVGEPVAYLHADKDGKVLWSESCVCEDAVWPHIDEYESNQSLPVYRKPTHSITAAELGRLRKDAALGQHIRAEYNSMKTSTSERFLEALGVELDEYAGWEGVTLETLLGIDAAIAAEGEK